MLTCPLQELLRIKTARNEEQQEWGINACSSEHTLFRVFYCLFFFKLATKIEITTRYQDSTQLSAQHERAKKYCQESMLFGAFNLLFLKTRIWTHFHYGKKECRCLEWPWFPSLMVLKPPPGLTFHRNLTHCGVLPFTQRAPTVRAWLLRSMSPLNEHSFLRRGRFWVRKKKCV